MIPEPVLFSLLSTARSIDAYKWHRAFASASPGHIYPRDWATFEKLASQGRVFAATHLQDFLGLAYFTQDDSSVWEIGGLMVATSERGNGVASNLFKLVLAHLLFEENPLSRGETVVAHVHSGNQDPRPLIQHSLRFTFAKSIKVPGDILPGLAVDSEGFVTGDEFHISPASLSALSQWASALPSVLKDLRPMRIEFREGITPAMWSQAFAEMKL